MNIHFHKHVFVVGVWSVGQGWCDGAFNAFECCWLGVLHRGWLLECLVAHHHLNYLKYVDLYGSVDLSGFTADTDTKSACSQSNGMDGCFWLGWYVTISTWPYKTEYNKVYEIGWQHTQDKRTFCFCVPVRVSVCDSLAAAAAQFSADSSVFVISPVCHVNAWRVSCVWSWILSGPYVPVSFWLSHLCCISLIPCRHSLPSVCQPISSLLSPVSH